MKKLYLLLPFILLFSKSEAQTGTWDWGQNGVYTLNNGPVVQSDIWCTGADVFGNGYITGPFWGNLTVNGQPLNNSTTDDQVMTIKWDSSGALQWAKQSVSLNSSFFSFAATYDVTADGFGAAYITGNFGDTMIFDKDTLFAPKQRSDMFLLKYDKNGNVRWSRQATGNFRADRSIGTALTVDKRNHIYVAGEFVDTISLGSTHLNNKRQGLFIAKYDTGGNLIWAKNTSNFTTASIAFYGNPSGPYSIKTDIYNNLLVTGLFTDTLTYGSTSIYAPAGKESLFVLKFDSNAKLIWAKQGLNDSSFENDPVYVATDNAGAVYCGGTYSGTGSFGSKTLPASVPNTNFFIVKMDSAGNFVWVKTTNNSKSSRWFSDKLANDNNNHLYVCGYGASDSIVYDNTPITTSQGFNGDGFSALFEIDTTGKLLCSSLVAGAGDDFNGMAVDASGKYVYLGGDLLEQMTLDDSIILYNGGSQFGPQEVPFIARWSPCAGCDAAVSVNPQSPSVCKGQSVILTASGEPNYTWSPATGLNTTTGSSVIVTDTTNTTYTIIGTGGCKTDTSTVIVTIISAPNKPTITKQGDVLTSSATQGNQWQINDTSINGATNQSYTISKAGCYSVEVINPANGCSSTSDTTCLTPTGINQLAAANSQLSIYPNPTTGQFTVTTNGNHNGNMVEVYNVLGQLVYQSVVAGTTITINLNSSPAGIYFVYLKSDEGVEVGKVLVAK